MVQRQSALPPVETVNKPLRSVVLLVTNNRFPFPDRAAETIDKIRGTGQWKGDIVIALAPDIVKYGQKSVALFKQKGAKTVQISDLMAGVNMTVPQQCRHGNYNNLPKRQQGWVGYYYKLAILNSTYFRQWQVLAAAHPHSRRAL